jgi:acetolactate synthase-1/2/3 large subunit
VHDVKRIPYDLPYALRAATSDKQGPAYISIPLDEMYKKVDVKEIPPLRAYRTPNRSVGDPAAVRQAVELLRKAKQLLVIGGRGVRMSGAYAQLQQFIEKGNLPLYTGFYRWADVPENHPLNFGLVQPFFGSTAQTGVQQTDVVLAVGVIFDFTLGYGQPPFLHKDAKVIQVNIEGADIGRNCPADVGIVGDPARVLEQLTAELTDADANLGSEKWLGKIRNAAEQVQKAANTCYWHFRKKTIESAWTAHFTIVLRGIQAQRHCVAPFPRETQFSVSF